MAVYSSQGVDICKIDHFLEGIAVPGVAGGTRDNLEAEITNQEVFAIANLSGMKSPGPGGFPMDFLKAFTSDLITPLMDMLRHAIKINQLPKTLEHNQRPVLRIQINMAWISFSSPASPNLTTAVQHKLCHDAG